MKKHCVLALCLLLLCVPVHIVFSQNEEAPDLHEPAPPQRHLFADIGYSALGVITSNTFLNIGARLADQPFADVTFQTIWDNILNDKWFWENGDRFLVNQFGHPYQGSTYFASARANGFDFYESMLFVPLGSIMWEVLLEPQPAINDFVTTTVGGIALGEILHRLFLEVDALPSIGAKIGGFFVSPLSSFNKVYNRPARGAGGGNIYELSVSSGIEKTFAFFTGHAEEADSWKYPGGYIDMNVAYANPFVQQSKTPYEHFELYAGLATNTASYQAAVVSDGYLFSFTPVQTDAASMSTGLSLHFDFFNATNDLLHNLGYGNLQFSSSAVGWTVKRRQLFSESSCLETKAHAAFTFWGNSMYNGDEYIVSDYWVPLGNNRSTYGMGENVKLFLAFSHTKAGRLELAAHGYHIFALPINEKHSRGSVFFLHGSLGYDFPLSGRMGIGAKGTFWGLFGLYDSAEHVNRRLASSCLYVRFMV